MSSRHSRGPGAKLSKLVCKLCIYGFWRISLPEGFDITATHKMLAAVCNISVAVIVCNVAVIVCGRHCHFCGRHFYGHHCCGRHYLWQSLYRLSQKPTFFCKLYTMQTCKVEIFNWMTNFQASEFDLCGKYFVVSAAISRWIKTSGVCVVVQVVEYDTPSALLEVRESAFSRLLEASKVDDAAQCASPPSYGQQPLHHRP